MKSLTNASLVTYRTESAEECSATYCATAWRRCVFPMGGAQQISIKSIQDAVCDRFALSSAELCGDKRSQNIVYPRQVAMYLSRELTDSSLPKIGREFGRDHTTVIHATAKITRLIREDRSVYNLVQELTARVKQVR